MADIADLLNRGLLADGEGVGADTRRLLASENFSTIITFAEDSYICRQGKPLDALFFTLDGLFHAISHANAEAPQRLLGRVEAGQFIGEMSVIDGGGPASASVKAMRSSRALRMTREAFAAFCRTHPENALEFVRAVARQLGRRLRDANEKLL